MFETNKKSIKDLNKYFLLFCVYKLDYLHFCFYIPQWQTVPQHSAKNKLENIFLDNFTGLQSIFSVSPYSCIYCQLNPIYIPNSAKIEVHLTLRYFKRQKFE